MTEDLTPGDSAARSAAPGAVAPGRPSRDARAAPAPPRAAREWKWRSALREFGVIVAGVLVALGAQALWEAAQEREREESYLRQLQADAFENEERLDRAIAEDSTAVWAGSRVLSALSGGPAPPRDSLLHWILLMGRASEFQPLTGTHNALLGTGELRLVRSDTLRAVLMTYASAVDREYERLYQLRGAALDAIMPLARALPFMRTVFTGEPRPEQLDIVALRASEEAGAVLFTLHAAAVNRLGGLYNLRRETRQLLTVLGRVLGESRPPPEEEP